MATNIRQFLAKAARIIVYTRLYLALGSGFIVLAFAGVMDLDYSIALASVASLTIFSVYTTNRKSDLEEDEVNMEFVNSTLANRIFYLGLGSLILATAIASVTEPLLILSMLVLISVLVVYSVDILPKSFKYRRLKEMPFVKNILVAGAFSFFLVSSALLFNNASITSAALVLFGFMFARVLIGSIIPDIRDIEGDRKAGVNTIPVLYGAQNTKYLLYFTNLVVTVFFYGAVIQGYLPHEAWIPGLINFAGFPIIYLTNRETAGKMTVITEVNDLYVFPLLFLLSQVI